MKHTHITLITIFALGSLAASDAVPLRWTVETSRAVPAQFEAYQGETIALEAALQSYGKPLEAPSGYSLYWQTNGMGNAYWSTPCTVPASSLAGASNVLFAIWSPTNDVGARVYNCFIGKPGTIYHAAFQLRLRPSPGALPNELPLPQKVIDFAKVTVLNPPWSGGGGGGGVDTNAFVDIIHKTVDGSARMLPPYLHYLKMDDTYQDAAAEWYAQADYNLGACSSVRDGNTLSRNYDWNFDFMPEFVVSCVATAPSSSCRDGRFASLAVCNVGTNLTEADVTSGKWSKWYKALPGHAVDGINENGVACNINVVDGEPEWGSGLPTASSIHPLAAVRWILDHATNAQHGATYIAENIRFPEGWAQNFHYMVADSTSTYIVENGEAHPVPSSLLEGAVLTNFRLYPTRDTTGEGQERYDALVYGSNITSQWWTLTYTAAGYRASDLPGITGDDLTQLFDYWASKPRESHRGEAFNGISWWQTVHTSVYDISNRVLRVAVQETDDWYTFQVPASGAKSVESYTRSEIDAKLGEKRDLDDLTVYEKVPTAWTITGTWDDPYTGVKPYRVTPLDDVIWVLENANGTILDEQPISSDGTRVEFGYGVTATRSFYLQPVSPADRLATTNGVNAAISALDIPSKTSDLENDSGFLAPDGTGLLTVGWIQCTDGNVYAVGGFRAPVWDYYVNEDFQTLPEYLASGEWNTSSNPFAKVSQLPVISATNTTFSNAVMGVASHTNAAFAAEVLAVGLNIDTNSVAVLNEIAATFGDFPITGTATTVGGLLAALAAAIAWLRKRAAHLDNSGFADNDFATNLIGKQVAINALHYALYSVPTTGADANKLKDRAVNAFAFSGGSLPTFPAQVTGYARDFLLNVTATADGSNITIPEPDGSTATSIGDALAFTAGKTYIVAITEIAAKHYYIRVIDTTPANAA